MEAHRQAQRADRGGLLRPRPRARCSAVSARSSSGFDDEERRSSTRRASARSSCRGIIMPVDDVRRQPRLRRHRRRRRPAWSRRARSASATCRRSSSTRGSSPSRSAQLGSMANLLQSGVASAERVFELLDADEQVPDPASRRHDRRDDRRRGTVVASSRTSRSATTPRSRSSTTSSLDGRAGPVDRDRRPDGRGQDDPRQPASCGSTSSTAAASRSTASTSRAMTARRAALAHGHGAAGHLAVRRAPSARTSPTADRMPRRRRSSTAARATYVDRFVHSLPDGYDTVLDDEASNLSAGEKQLITIARAFLAHPSGAHPRRGDELGRHAHRAAAAAGHERAARATARAS